MFTYHIEGQFHFWLYFVSLRLKSAFLHVFNALKFLVGSCQHVFLQYFCKILYKTVLLINLKSILLEKITCISRKLIKNYISEIKWSPLFFVFSVIYEPFLENLVL